MKGFCTFVCAVAMAGLPVVATAIYNLKPTFWVGEGAGVVVPTLILECFLVAAIIQINSPAAKR